MALDEPVRPINQPPVANSARFGEHTRRLWFLRTLRAALGKGWTAVVRADWTEVARRQKERGRLPNRRPLSEGGRMEP
jgi:hypothetical protein